jgi:hypothetical protein
MFYLWPENIWQNYTSNISNFYYLNTVWYLRILEGRWTTNLRCCFHLQQGRILCQMDSQSLQWCIFTPVNREKQIPTLLHYYNTYQQDWFQSLSLYSLKHQSQTLWQLHKATMNRTQFSYTYAITCPPNVVTSLTSQTCFGPWRAFIKE